MKNTIQILASIGSALIIAACTLSNDDEGDEKKVQTVTLEIEGTAGQSVTSQIETDGVAETSQFSIPASLDFSAKTLDFTIQLDEPISTETFTINAYLDGEPLMSASDTSGITGHVETTGVPGSESPVHSIGGMTAGE